MGASVPVGAFKTTRFHPLDPKTDVSTGLYADLLFKCPSRQSNFQLAWVLGFSTHAYDITALLENYQLGNPGLQWSTSGSNWISISLMPGVNYTIPVSAYIRFNAAFFTGASAVHAPAYLLVGINKSNNSYAGQATAEQLSAWAIALSSRLTTDVQFKVSNKTTLLVQAGYQYLQPTFSKVVQTTYEVTEGEPGGAALQVSSSRRQFSHTQTMSTLHVGAGLLFGL